MENNKKINLLHYTTEELDNMYAVLVSENSEDSLKHDIEAELERRIHGRDIKPRELEA